MRPVEERLEERWKNKDFFKIKEIIGDKKAIPPIPPIIPVSRSGWYDGISKGLYPPPIKFTNRSGMWRVSDIIKLIRDGFWIQNEYARNLHESKENE